MSHTSFFLLVSAMFCAIATAATVPKKLPAATPVPEGPFVFNAPTATSAPTTTSTPVCRYKFCSGKTSFQIGRTTGISFTRSICDFNNNRIGTVGESGEALIIDGNEQTPISKWNPTGLKQKFDASFFKTFAIYSGKHSGIGHQAIQRNQREFLVEKRCWVLPFKTFQLIDAKGNAVNNYSRDSGDCVQFCTTL